MRRRFFNNSSVREGAVMQFEHSVTYTFPFDCVVDLFLVGGGAVEALLIIQAITGMVDVVGLPVRF